MRRGQKVFSAIATATAFAAAGAVPANAAWAVQGTAAVKVRVAKMPRGLQPRVVKDGMAATVTWDPQEIVPGVNLTGYIIIAHSVGDAARPDVTRSVAATISSSQAVTFTTREIAGGSWRWTLIPKLHGWMGAESPVTKELTFPPRKSTTSLAAGAAPTDAAGKSDEGSSTPSPENKPSSSLDTQSTKHAPEAGDPTKMPEPTAEPEETATAGPTVDPTTPESGEAASDDESADK